MSRWEIIKDDRISGGANSALTPEVAAELGAALGTLLGEGTLVVTARDYYPPSRMLKRSFSAGLMSTGVTVVDFHAATFPELAFAVKKFGAKAGVHFTVSLKGSDEVTIKLLDYLGIEFSHERLSNLLRLFKTKHIVRTLPERIGWVTYAEYIHEIYVASLTSYLDSASIAERRPSVVADLHFGPSADVIPDMFSELGVDAVTLNAHKPPAKKGIRHTPTPFSLLRLGRMVKAAAADLGVAFCVDASRAVFTDDKGRVLTPDETVALFMLTLPENTTVVTTISASKIIDKVAEQRKLRVIRVRGHPGDISRQIRRARAAYGGSDTGEHVFPTFSLAPDGLLALGKMLEVITSTERRLSSIIDELPRVPKHREEVDVPPGISLVKVLDIVTDAIHPSRVTVTGVKAVVNKVPIYVEPVPYKRALALEVEEPDREKLEVLRKVRDHLEEVFSSATAAT